MKNFQLLTAKLMGLEGSDAERFFSKISEEYRKLPPERKRGWLPVLYVGVRY